MQGGFVIQEKLSHEKEVQRKAETEKKDVELRDKILYAFSSTRVVLCRVSCVMRVVRVVSCA
jgi:hypothetical protein